MCRSPEAAEAHRQAAIASIEAVFSLKEIYIREPDVDGLRARYRRLWDELVWTYTEAPGKFWGQRYWSRAALKQYQQQLGSGKPHKGLCHDHVIEREGLFRAFLNSESPAHSQALLERAVSCVLTVKEHDDVRKTSGHCWDRYRGKGIKVLDLGPEANRQAFGCKRRKGKVGLIGQWLEAAPALPLVCHCAGQ